MARVFNGTSRIKDSTTGVNSSIGGRTVATWIKLNSTASAWHVFQRYQNNSYYMGLRTNSSAQFEWYIRTLSTTAPVANTASISTGQWYHVVGTLDSSRYAGNASCWVNGVEAVTLSSIYLNGPNHDNVTLGGYNNGGGTNGSLFWTSIWDAYLSDAEIISLSKGVCPVMVRSDALKMFMPCGGLHGEHDRDYIGTANNFTAISSPTWSDDSPTGLIYPQRSIIGLPGAGGSAPIDYTARQLIVKNTRLSISNNRISIGR
jgi:hypothetical protein